MKLKLFLLTLVVSALLFCSGAAIEGADIVYYNSFDSATAVTAPVVGAAGTCDGAATFGEGKNGKALFVPARAVSPIKVPFANGLPAEKGCIEFWAKIEPTSNYADRVKREGR